MTTRLKGIILKKMAVTFMSFRFHRIYASTEGLTNKQAYPLNFFVACAAKRQIHLINGLEVFIIRINAFFKLSEINAKKVCTIKKIKVSESRLNAQLKNK
jgi:hypothetical protein